ncbi:hypothetical protein BDW02DRAFT_498520 [Decorospora gaudefroyi]|uniref:Bys1 family protein n=1 Tax=Decorospora gaudefroyi TaxID=184978 RepID=A0A6A5KLK2_9PLEO|nr:hypothetical protein BDW02DRAFT_498520 [Decorospora gaudefroyi]
MRVPALAATVALAANTAFAISTASVHNKCNFPVWVTSVSDIQGEAKMLAPGSYYTETQQTAQDGVGTAIKITRTETGLYTSAPVLIFGYSYKEHAQLYYGLSTAFGFDFWDQKLRIHNTDGLHVEEIIWMGEPKPDYTAAFLGAADLTLELCDDFAQTDEDLTEDD